MLIKELAALRGTSTDDPSVTLDAALLALSGRIRITEGGSRTAEEIVTELWRRHFAPQLGETPQANEQSEAQKKA
jgi:MoxR-like ATPase